MFENIVISGVTETLQSSGPYVPIVEAIKPKTTIIPSKTLVINELNVTIEQNFDEDIRFSVSAKPGVLSDNKTIPKLDITAREDLDFDENLTKSKLESIIRRCGILNEYKDYFVSDPEIIINQYTLSLKKTYKYFNEFRDSVLIASEVLEDVVE